MQKLMNAKKIARKYKEISKYPAQVEDLTLTLPDKTFVGDVLSLIASHKPLVSNVQLTDIYKNQINYEDNYTFNIEYQSTDHTLTDKEVEAVRNKIISSLKSKFGITNKD